MKKRLEEMSTEQAGKLVLFALPLWAPIAMIFIFALWGWAGVAAHFMASAWGF